MNERVNAHTVVLPVHRRLLDQARPPAYTRLTLGGRRIHSQVWWRASGGPAGTVEWRSVVHLCRWHSGCSWSDEQTDHAVQGSRADRSRCRQRLDRRQRWTSWTETSLKRAAILHFQFISVSAFVFVYSLDSRKAKNVIKRAQIIDWLSTTGGGAENAGVENVAPDSKGGKRGSGKRGSWMCNRWGLGVKG